MGSDLCCRPPNGGYFSQNGISNHVSMALGRDFSENSGSFCRHRSNFWHQRGFLLLRETDVPRGRLFRFRSSCLGSGRSGTIVLSSLFKPASSFLCKPSRAIKIVFCARTNCSIAGSLPRGNFTPRYHYPRSSIPGKCNHRHHASARKKMADATPADCRSFAPFLFAHASCLNTH